MKWTSPLLALTALLLGLALVASAEPASPAVQPAVDGVITTRWISGNTIEICTTEPGRLYALAGNGGWWIGELDAGCRQFPPADVLIDAAFAPAPGRVYGLQTIGGVWHSAAPLPVWHGWRVWLPVVAR